MTTNKPELISTYRGFKIYEMPDGSFARSSYEKDGEPKFDYRRHNTAWSVKVGIDEELQP